MTKQETLLKALEAERQSMLELAATIEVSKSELATATKDLASLLAESESSVKVHPTAVTGAQAASVLAVALGLAYSMISVNSSPIGTVLTSLTCSAPILWLEHIDKFLAALVLLSGVGVYIYDAHTRRLKVTLNSKGKSK